MVESLALVEVVFTVALASRYPPLAYPGAVAKELEHLREQNLRVNVPLDDCVIRIMPDRT